MKPLRVLLLLSAFALTSCVAGKSAPTTSEPEAPTQSGGGGGAVVTNNNGLTSEQRLVYGNPVDETAQLYVVIEAGQVKHRLNFDMSHYLYDGSYNRVYSMVLQGFGSGYSEDQLYRNDELKFYINGNTRVYPIADYYNHYGGTARNNLKLQLRKTSYGVNEPRLFVRDDCYQPTLYVTCYSDHYEAFLTGYSGQHYSDPYVTVPNPNGTELPPIPPETPGGIGGDTGTSGGGGGTLWPPAVPNGPGGNTPGGNEGENQGGNSGGNEGGNSGGNQGGNEGGNSGGNQGGNSGGNNNGPTEQEKEQLANDLKNIQKTGEGTPQSPKVPAPGTGINVQIGKTPGNNTTNGEGQNGDLCNYLKSGGVIENTYRYTVGETYAGGGYSSLTWYYGVRLAWYADSGYVVDIFDPEAPSSVWIRWSIDAPTGYNGSTLQITLSKSRASNLINRNEALGELSYSLLDLVMDKYMSDPITTTFGIYKVLYSSPTEFFLCDSGPVISELTVLGFMFAYEFFLALAAASQGS